MLKKNLITMHQGFLPDINDSPVKTFPVTLGEGWMEGASHHLYRVRGRSCNDPEVWIWNIQKGSDSTKFKLIHGVNTESEAIKSFNNIVDDQNSRRAIIHLHGPTYKRGKTNEYWYERRLLQFFFIGILPNEKAFLHGDIDEKKFVILLDKTPRSKADHNIGSLDNLHWREPIFYNEQEDLKEELKKRGFLDIRDRIANIRKRFDVDF